MNMLELTSKISEFKRDMMEFFNPICCSYSVDINCWIAKLLKNDGLGAAIDLDMHSVNFLADISGQKVRRSWHCTPGQLEDAAIFKFYHRCKMDLAMALPEYFQSGYDAEVFEQYEFDVPHVSDKKKEKEMPDLREHEVSVVKKRVFGLLKEVAAELKKLPEKELDKMGQQFAEALLKRISEDSIKEGFGEEKKRASALQEAERELLKEQKMRGMPSENID